jgi:hypothetical protein
LFETIRIDPPSSLILPDVVPYCSLLMTHASGEKFKASPLAERKESCIGIGIQGFNEKSLGEDVSKLLESIVSPDMSYFGKYESHIVQLAYSHMHPLTHWNMAVDAPPEKGQSEAESSEHEYKGDSVFTPEESSQSSDKDEKGHVPLKREVPGEGLRQVNKKNKTAQKNDEQGKGKKKEQGISFRRTSERSKKLQK